MERQRFEEEWRIAFLDGEREPSSSVWTNVELQLERESGGQMKRRLLMFQLLAAASMVFALGIGSFYYLSTSSAPQDSSIASLNTTESGEGKPETTDKELAVERKSELVEESENTTHTALNDPAVQESVESYSSRKKVKKLEPATALAANLTEDDDKRLSTNAALPIVAKKDNNRSLLFADRALPLLYSYNAPSLSFEKETVDPGMALLARLEAEEQKYREEDQRKKQSRDEGMWTSLGVSAGTYDPNMYASSSSARPSFTSAATTAPSNPTPGSAYSVGLALGGKLNKRLVVQGGLVYLTQNAEYTSSAVSGGNVALNEVSLTGDRISASSPYSVNSNMTYLSVPVQAGYIVLDKAFAIQLNGGVSTDFFMRNKLSSDNTQFSDVSGGPGSDSPYRSVNFSGLVGTEFSYRFSEHYRVSLNPGLRYALNSIYKSDVQTSISPVTFDVGLRFKYIF